MENGFAFNIICHIQHTHPQRAVVSGVVGVEDRREIIVKEFQWQIEIVCFVSAVEI